MPFTPGKRVLMIGIAMEWHELYEEERSRNWSEPGWKRVQRMVVGDFRRLDDGEYLAEMVFSLFLFALMFLFLGLLLEFAVDVQFFSH